MFAPSYLVFALLAVSIPVLAIPRVAAPPTADRISPTNIKVAAAAAAYAVRTNSTATDDYVDLFDVTSVHVGRYASAEFIAAITTATPANCDMLSPDQVKLLRGWLSFDAAMSAAINSCTGGFVTPELRPVWTTNEGGITIGYSCAGPGPYNISGAEPHCSTQEQVVQGRSTGATGVVTASYSTGEATSLTLTTTSSSTMSIGVTVTVGVNIKVFEASVSATYTQSVTNEKSKSEEHTLSSQGTIGVQMTPTGPNSQCALKFNTTSCQSTGVVRVPFVATGWIATKAADFKGLVCGYRQAEQQIVYFNIDANLANDKLRSSVMELQGAVRGQMNSMYDISCT
ncbi:hypothetical protein B0H16DRAFT_1801135 [Mycena metata]|uniref:Uncharacterized protein n=1 Tax=Mycena metata TaxID=1033252 RepID=A0AAD7JFL3_9AGAR|nr:hypothetical protein B0H16DRAFT_1801135 [Mycena metata]